MPQIGQSISTHPRYAKIKSYNLKNFGFKIGDLVIIKGYQPSANSIIYSITGDILPCVNATWGAKTCKVRSYLKRDQYTTYVKHGWLNKNGKLLSMLDVIGNIELTPVFSFMNQKPMKKRRIRYDHVNYKVEKIDIIRLGKTFASFKDFIDSELKKIQESLYYLFMLGVGSGE